MLHGDTADYIPGLEGYKTTGPKGNVMFKQMGEKTAEKFFEGCTSTDEACAVVRGLYKEFYEAKGQNWSDRFVEQAALLWMRTDNKARVADFAHHRGPSKINGAFCADIWAAVERLEDRVRDARAEADALTG
jgi:DNA polymerase-1